MTKGLLAAGTVKAGEHRYLYIDPCATVALYVTNGDYVHPGKCLDAFLDVLWATGAYRTSDLNNDHYQVVWDDIVEAGGWTVEWGNVDEAQEYDPYFDPFTTPCLTCHKSLL